jgi:hypothetical protein
LGEGLKTAQNKKTACYKVLHRTSDLDGIFGTRLGTWEGNIKMDLMEAVWEGVHWIHLVQVGGRGYCKRWVIS